MIVSSHTHNHTMKVRNIWNAGSAVLTKAIPLHKVLLPCEYAIFPQFGYYHCVGILQHDDILLSLARTILPLGSDVEMTNSRLGMVITVAPLDLFRIIFRKLMSVIKSYACHFFEQNTYINRKMVA